MKKIMLLGLMLCLMAVSVSAWWDNGWTRRDTLTINNPTGSSLTQFPMYIKIPYDSDMQNDYDDLRLVASDDVTELPYEKESYNGSYVYIWFASNLTIGYNTIYLYYGNASVSTGENPTAVWDSNYIGVWHFSGNADDSTSNNLDGTLTVAPTQTSTDCAVGSCYDYDGSTEYITLPTDAPMDLGTGDFTYEIWWDAHHLLQGVYPTPASNGIADVGSWDGLNVELDTGHATNRFISGRTGDGIPPPYTIYNNQQLNANQTYYGMLTRQNQFGNWYIDGAWDGNGTLMKDINVSRDFTMARNPPPTIHLRWFDGTLDEFRLSDISRSPEYAMMTYQSVVNQSNVVSFAGEEELCIIDWYCGLYGDCNTSDQRPCIEATDNNSCGYNYTGDYSEFGTQACDYCTPDFYCSNLQLDCPANKIKECYVVGDYETCYAITGLPSDDFNGTVTDYNEDCGYVASYESTDLSLIITDILGNFGVEILAVMGLIVITGVVGFFAVRGKWFARLMK